MRFQGWFRPDKNTIYDKGVDALRKKDMAGALKYFSKVVEIDPADAEALYNLGVCYVDAKSYSAAAESFRECVRLNCDRDHAVLNEQIAILEKAAAASSPEAEEIWADYLRSHRPISEKVEFSGLTIRVEDLWEAAIGLLQEDGFPESAVVQKFEQGMSAKIPIRFYGIKELENIAPQDAFGFAIAFSTTGYAVAKASHVLMGNTAYVENLTADALIEYNTYANDAQKSLSYDMETLKNGNPIPWRLVQRVLEQFINNNLADFLDRIPYARSRAVQVKENLVREFVYVGYNVGLWENMRR